MRSKWRVSVVSSLSILAIFLCAANAGGIGDSIGKSVDELIDESNGIFTSGNQPRSPQEARNIWSEESGVDLTPLGNQSEKSTETGPSDAGSAIITGDGVSYQTASSSDSSSANTVSAISTSAQANAASSTAAIAAAQGTTDNASAAAAQTSVSPAGSTSPPGDVAGNWSFRLRDSKTRVLALTLYQSGNTVFGTGSINDGGESLKVSASGGLSEDKLILDATSSGTVVLYRMALTTDGRSASGEYGAFTQGETPWMGIVEGTRIAE